MGVVLEGKMSNADGLTGELSYSIARVGYARVGYAKLSMGTLSGKLSSLDTLTGLLSTQISHIDYTGETVVTPKAFESTVLRTANKIVTTDIEVLEIPYEEVSNESGGYTVSIG